MTSRATFIFEAIICPRMVRRPVFVRSLFNPLNYLSYLHKNMKFRTSGRYLQFKPGKRNLFLDERDIYIFYIKH